MLKVRQAQQHLQQEPSNINSITDLVEISMWLGTYRERMRLARSEDQQELAAAGAIDSYSGAPSWPRHSRHGRGDLTTRAPRVLAGNDGLGRVEGPCDHRPLPTFRPD